MKLLKAAISSGELRSSCGVLAYPTMEARKHPVEWAQAMHNLYPQKQPPTLSAITLGFVIATFLPPVAYFWLNGGSLSHEDVQSPGWWIVVAMPIAMSLIVGIILGCSVSSDLPVGCAILLSPLIPAALCFAILLGTMIWTQEQPFSRALAWTFLLSLMALLLSTPTAGVFVLTRWLVKGRV